MYSKKIRLISYVKFYRYTQNSASILYFLLNEGNFRGDLGSNVTISRYQGIIMPNSLST